MRCHSQHLLGVLLPVRGQPQHAVGRSLPASSPTKRRSIRRRLWWRFLCQGSGKNIRIESNDWSAMEFSSTSTASWQMMRRLASRSAWARRSSRPTPARCTSMPR